MDPGGIGGALQILAGEVGRVRKGGLLDSKDHAGPMLTLGWGTIQDHVWPRRGHKCGRSYSGTGR